MHQCGKAISAIVHAMMISPTGMDSNVKKALSLYLMTAISPMMKPITPISARTGVGNGNLMAAPNPSVFDGHQHDESQSQASRPFPGCCFGPKLHFHDRFLLILVQDKMLHQVNCR